MVIYYGFLEGRLGATPGKALFGLRVVDVSNEPPGLYRAMVRALAFGVPLQTTTRIATFLMLGSVPLVSVKFVGACAAGVCLVVLFCTARRSNGYAGLHDRGTATRVVLKRDVTEARRRHDRTAADLVPPSGDARIGPYLVPAEPAWPVATAVSIEGYDDRLSRRVWLDLLPPGAPALSPLRRDLGRSGRARWLGGRRNAGECWDAYEGIEGEPIHETASRPQPWSRVRHWLEDLAHEMAAGLDDGSLPPLHARRVWIDRDDRGRILDWTDPGTGGPTLDPSRRAGSSLRADPALRRFRGGAPRCCAGRGAGVETGDSASHDGAQTAAVAARRHVPVEQSVGRRRRQRDGRPGHFSGQAQSPADRRLRADPFPDSGRDPGGHRVQPQGGRGRLHPHAGRDVETALAVVAGMFSSSRSLGCSARSWRGAA